jgi:hypothetical protein
MANLHLISVPWVLISVPRKNHVPFHGEFKKSRKIIEVLLIEKKISDLGKANSLFNEI